MASSPADPGKEWEAVLESLNMALRQGESWPQGRESPLCGQTVSIVIPERESAHTSRTLRLLLLREIDKEVKALGAA